MVWSAFDEMPRCMYAFMLASVGRIHRILCLFPRGPVLLKI